MGPGTELKLVTKPKVSVRPLKSTRSPPGNGMVAHKFKFFTDDSLAQAFFPARQGEAGVDRAFALESRDVHTVIPWQTLPDKTQVALEVG
jgi:hypothetical protein